jgi:hypothetical protein
MSEANSITDTEPIVSGPVPMERPARGNPNWYKGMPQIGVPGAKANARPRRRQRLMGYLERIAKKYNLPCVDPLEVILFIGMTGQDPLEEHYRTLVSDEEWNAFFPKNTESWLYRDKDGWVRIKGFIKPETRLDCLKAALPYVHGKIGTVDPPSEVDEKLSFETRSNIMQEIAADPTVRAAMETITEKSAAMRLEARSGDGADSLSDE